MPLNRSSLLVALVVVLLAGCSGASQRDDPSATKDSIAMTPPPTSAAPSTMHATGTPFSPPPCDEPYGTSPDGPITVRANHSTTQRPDNASICIEIARIGGTGVQDVVASSYADDTGAVRLSLASSGTYRAHVTARAPESYCGFQGSLTFDHVEGDTALILVDYYKICS
jgi:hypothetical protein